MNTAFVTAALLAFGLAVAQAGNPVFKGWYADPDLCFFKNRYWIYPTFSARYEEQTFLDTFSSDDLVTWTKHPKIIGTDQVKWATKAMWAPCTVEKDGKYYLFFSANDVHEGEIGGIGVAVSDKPEGPFKDHLGKPLINEIWNGAQPIDQAVFQEPKTKQWYILYGGWGHCNLAKLNADFTGLIPFDDGKMVHEITPKGYAEGPMMFFKDARVYFMWSEGGWTDSSYQVAYAIGDSIDGPFERIGTVIEKNDALAAGAGHHSVLKLPNEDAWYFAYHRRPAGDKGRDHRVTCVEKMEFDQDGKIKPVIMTKEGVGKRVINK